MERLILGKNTSFQIDESNQQTNNHVAVIGGSSSGKTHSIVKPNIFNFANAGSSMIISDPKGALEKEFKDYLISKGYKTFSIDLIHPEKSSCTFNIFSCIRQEIDFIKIAHSIIYDRVTRNSTHLDPFWAHQAEIVLSAVLELVAIFEKDDRKSLDRVIYYISRLKCDTTGLTNIMMDEISEVKQDSLLAKQWTKIKAMMSADKTFACTIASVQEHLGRYENTEMEQFFHKKNEIHFTEFAEKKCVLFLKVSDTNDCYYDFADLIYSQAITCLNNFADATENGWCPIPVRFIFDDFGTNVYVDGLHRVISTARARNISFMLICQSIQQLKSGYKDDYQTILSNCDTMVFMGSNDRETCEEFSIRLDLPVQQLLWLKRGFVYIFRAGEEPIKDHRYDYRQHESYLELFARNEKEC